MVCYDRTVRNSLGGLVQSIYGEDGMDGAFIEKKTIERIIASSSTITVWMWRILHEVFFPLTSIASFKTPSEFSIVGSLPIYRQHILLMLFTSSRSGWLWSGRRSLKS